MCGRSSTPSAASSSRPLGWPSLYSPWHDSQVAPAFAWVLASQAVSSTAWQVLQTGALSCWRRGALGAGSWGCRWCSAGSSAQRQDQRQDDGNRRQDKPVPGRHSTNHDSSPPSVALHRWIALEDVTANAFFRDVAFGVETSLPAGLVRVGRRRAIRPLALAAALLVPAVLCRRAHAGSRGGNAGLSIQAGALFLGRAAAGRTAAAEG